MRRLRLGFLATLVAIGVAGSGLAGTGVGEPALGHDAEQARTAEVEPSTPRDALIIERSGTALLRRLASDRDKPRRDPSATSLAVAGGLVLLALAARGRFRLQQTGAGATIALDGVTARGPPFRLA
jgi:hypothetical protein